MERSRIDIKMRNVFISWTGADCALKDRIVERLVAGKITCTVSDGKSSDGRCSGNFVQWSADAAKSANIFLLILTENTLRSAYVPLEIKEFLNIEDAENRIIVVCPSLALWRNAIFNYGGEKIKLSERNISITEMPDCVLTDKILDDVYAKTTDLINNRAYKVYREEISPKYIDILSLYDDDAPDRKIKFSDLYINRHVTEKDEYGNIVATYPSPELLVKCDDIFYICGPAGSGKTQYIHQLQNSVGEDSLVITLSCSKIATSSATLRELMFEEFCRVLGNPIYFTEDNFVNLLNNRRLVLVLDGLDEIASQSGVRTFIKKVEEEYYARHNADTTLFITGRDEKSSNRIALTGKKLRILYLEQLTDEETHTLGNNLFLSFGSSMNSDGFFVRIKDLQDEIKYNPLLLSQLAVIYKENGDVPNTVVGIFDAISKITLNIDASKHYTSIPERYMDMIEQISTLLKRFAQRRYILQSNDEECSPQEIFEDILFNDYKDDYSERAAFLVEFLLKRSILVDNGNRFYHKMFLEYFTAVYYYERSILRRKVADYDVFNELFAHYSDPYWAQVISMFLIKTDSLMNGTEMCNLLNELIKSGNIVDYTLLLDTCEGLGNNKQDAQVAIVCDILKKSAEKIYPPYGPLFWYVPTYSLYEQALLALNMLQGNAAALALVRDVCYIYGQKNTLADITDKVDGKALLSSAPSLKGVRRALCEIFYLGNTNYTDGKNIYPRCFNVAETLSMRDNSCGVGGKMSEPFRDELGLYSHESYNELNGEYMGFVSCPYDLDKVEQTLRAKATRRVTGIAYSPTHALNSATERNLNPVDKLFVEDPIKFTHPQFFNQTCVCYYPEDLDIYSTSKCTLNNNEQLFSVSISDYGILYLYGDVTFPFKDESCICDEMFFDCHRLNAIKLPNSITHIGDKAFSGSSLVSITLPDNLITLGEGVFLCCQNLTSVFVPSKVTQLKENTFENCFSLHTVVLPSHLRSIDKRCFGWCTSLQKINIPSSVTEIGEEAFRNCSSLVEVYLPSGITTISSDCFNACVSLKDVTIPQSVTQIHVNAFYGCVELSSIQAPGVQEIAYAAFSNCKALNSVRFGTLTSIGAHAFAECDSLSQVTLPDSLSIISKFAFAGCKKLTQVTIPNSVKQIEGGAFMNCSALASIDIPSSVTVVGNQAFYECAQLVNVKLHDGLQFVDNYAFSKCNSLREIYLPDSVTQVNNSFQDCEALAKVHLPCSLTKLGTSIFSGCLSLEEVHIPYSVTVIGSSAFAGCAKLKKIALPQSLLEIDRFAFHKCIALSAIDIPASVQKIGSAAFYGCANLQSVRLHKGLATIEHGAFNGCVKLRKIVIPHTVNSIDFSAFDNCDKLKIIVPQTFKPLADKWTPPKNCRIRFVRVKTSTLTLHEGMTEVTPDLIADKNAKQIIIPNGVEEIADEAFRNCATLTEITLPDSVKRIGNFAFADCNNLETVHMGEGLTTIGRFAFKNCPNLQNITLPDSVTTLGAYAFSGCNIKSIRLSSNLKVIADGTFKDCTLAELTLPEGVTELGDSALSGCKLSKLTLPSTIKKIGERAFSYLSGIDDIVIPHGVTEIAPSMFFSCFAKRIILPHGLETIGASAFFDCRISQLTIPETVQKIGFKAFMACGNLRELYLPDSVTDIQTEGKTGEYGAFASSGIKKVRLPRSMKEIPRKLFQHCHNLEEVDIPSGVTEIGQEAFANCDKLRTVRLPDTLELICFDAFVNCKSLTDVTIPNSVKYIQRGAFANCTSLTEISFNDNLDELGAIQLKDWDFVFPSWRRFNRESALGVFENCESLTKIHLPSELTVVDENLCAGCTNLQEIEIPNAVTEIKKLAFAHCISLRTLTVPTSVINIADDAFADTQLETLTISRNFENKIDSLFSNNKPKKIIYI
ncbi:MAG: leucine-rich repeat protein [Clostridiales bacterium]|nr:leucine-rich repeat protein [Clostridiales bacterium]